MEQPGKPAALCGRSDRVATAAPGAGLGLEVHGGGQGQSPWRPRARPEKIDKHQAHIAQAYGITKEQSRWLLATVTFSCISAADTVYSAARLEPLAGSDFVQEEAEMEAELVEGIHALIVGALKMLDRRS